jgi:3-hydroxy acid dehydrogenase / malonic semialdehyde reductase
MNILMLQGKTIFITGATAGFGWACAAQAAQAGAKVIACGRRKERLDELKKELGQNVHTIPLDVGDNDAVVKAIKSLPKEFSNIDVLINNAGGALGLAPFEQSSLEHAEQMVETNIMGVVYCTRAILPQMVTRNSGHIVNISSVAGSYPYPGGNVYGGTKAFVTQFSLNLRADLLGKNIRVTNVEPGLAETEFSLVRFEGDKSKADTVYKGVQPLTADDIADSILWCITRPAHVNVNRIEIMPTQQAFGPFAVHRDKN